ncbi:WXG100 family type VII secretion target [Clostridium felsineum]|uniref:ESAT-6-like protein n=1 Tax=Clostridium felsineum TaxID=36839 RepID=A0A1S8MC90_9CLOT|nr:WXG100 family type VII secretion target [Clostridium felsineum]URZ04999.1 hypothetical protein CLROS_003230 [Clostridium felsineum]URZ10040.1 hypothetical protein CROST_007480 [Clostridium felsineum]
MDLGNHYNASVMNSRIKVNVEEIEAMAKQYKDMASKVNSVLSSLNSTMNEVKENWKGKSSTAFESKYEGWKNNGTKYINELDRIADELKRKAENFRQADGM